MGASARSPGLPSELTGFAEIWYVSWYPEDRSGADQNQQRELEPAVASGDTLYFCLKEKNLKEGLCLGSEFKNY